MPGYADYANAIVSFSGNGAGNMRTMAIVVKRIVRIVDKVPAVKIVDEAVSIIVKKVTGNFVGVGPDIVRQVRMVIIHARIDHGYDHSITLHGVPRCRSIYGE